MMDIVGFTDDDLRMFDSQVPRAANILHTQLGSLEYEPLLGIDLAYFLDEKFSFQNESFKAYLVQVLANRGINVSSVEETIENLYTQLTISVKSDENSSSLVLR